MMMRWRYNDNGRRGRNYSSRSSSSGCSGRWSVVIEHRRKLNILEDNWIVAVIIWAKVAPHAVTLLVVVAASEFVSSCSCWSHDDTLNRWRCCAGHVSC